MDDFPNRVPVILVVDDDATIRCLIRDSLEADGFVVEEAGDGISALDTFSAVGADVVLLDVMMPNLDGFDTCRAIRESAGGAQTPIVMLTGMEDLDSVRRAYEIGATDFITKPFNPLVLSHRLRYILGANEAFKQLRRSEAALTRAQRLASLGSLEWDPSSDSLRASEEALRILGLEGATGSLRLGYFLDRVHSDDAKDVKLAMDAVFEGRGPVSLDYRVRLSDGTERYLHQEGALEESSSGKQPLVICSVQDVTQIRLAEKQIQTMAYYDSLTSLPNGVLFRDRLDQALARARRAKESLAVLFLDLDRFKRINDTLGHSAGDSLLKTTADRLLSTLRTGDAVSRAASHMGEDRMTFGRLGGDEFTVLLTNVQYVQAAAKVARRLLDALARPFNLGGREIYVTASIGLAMFPEDGTDAETLLKNADAAMYQAKSQGRNSFRFFSRAENQAAFERLTIENDLYRALEHRELVVHYQPRALIYGMRIVGAEALVRWLHPDAGLVGPETFLHVAEEAGLLAAIDEFVLKEACQQCRIWQAGRSEPLIVSVNVSGQSFLRQEYASRVKAAVRAVRLDPTCLELELTESIFMDDVESAIRKLRELKSEGIRIAIDDFGTGYSSLAHLKDLPLDCLKIDRSFVANIGKSHHSEAIVKAIIAMGKSLELNVVAEGVETEEQAAFLRAEGCTDVQGYLLSKPMAANHIEEVLFPDRASARPASDPPADRPEVVSEGATATSCPAREPWPPADPGA